MYEQIARNKRASWLLALGLVALLMALGFVMGLALFGSETAAFGVLGVFGIVAIVWSLIGYYAGSKMVLAVAGAREVSHDEAPQLWNVVEEMAIAGGIPLPRLGRMEIHGDRVSAKVISPVPIKQAALHFTADTGEWQKRRWQTVPAELKDNTLSAPLPEQRPLACYLAVIDERGLRLSTEHEEFSACR